jgi:predicted O-methyltransferase YrrM
MDAARIRSVIAELERTGSVTDGNGAERGIFPVALKPAMAALLRDWVLREKAARTIEVGLAYGFSTLHICEGLARGGNPEAAHTAMDPHQLTGYAGAGLRVLRNAGADGIVDFHPEESQLLLPRFVKEGRTFDLAFVDGNHRFDYVFTDLFFLGRLVRKGGVVILDDYNLPGIRKAASFFVANLNWTVEEAADRIVVLRTTAGSDSRDFTFLADF